jgi:superfamily II RNA helicase
MNTNTINQTNVLTLKTFNKPFFENPYSFELDDFQKNAIDIIKSNNPYNILVTAHTGSGKSLVAEFSIIHNFKNGKKTFYTSPIKALSNQKYDEFKRKFKDLYVTDENGNTRNIEIGLVTGDNKCNPLADCLILTTEILLNVIEFNKSLTTVDTESIDIGQVNALPSFSNVFDISLNDVNTVIFDEVHYINDQDRGGIWEQSILKLPPTINQILLSATLNNPENFATWIYNCNELPTYILPNYRRVVPLYFSVYYSLNKSLKSKLLNEKKSSNKQNPLTINKSKDVLSPEKVIEYCKLVDKIIPIKNTIDDKIDFKQYSQLEALNKHVLAHDFHKSIASSTIINNLIDYLSENSMTPCLFFVLSRNKIHQYIESCELVLNTVPEQNNVIHIFESNLIKLNSNYEHISMVEYVKKLAIRGFAIHHSGMLPILKEIIEILYAKNLIKVLFATETFSVGLNMPTKTVIFTSINKFDGTNFRNLYSHEFIQMAGRAGRRGIDEIGHVIYLPQLERIFTTSKSFESILNSKPQSLSSKYNIEPITIIKSIYYNHDIANDIKNTMWYAEKKIIKNGLYHELNVVTEKLNIDLELDDNTLKLLSEYYNIEHAEFKVSNGKKKQLEIQKKIGSFEKIYSIYCNYAKLMSQKKTLTRQIAYYENIISESINECLSFLENNGFVKVQDNNNYKLTNLGKTVIYFGDCCNPLLIAKLIENDDFNKLSCVNAVTTLSMFCDNNYNDNLFPINDTKIKYIYEYIDTCQLKMVNELNRFEIKITSDWNITPNNFDIVYDWLNDIPYNEITDKYETYEGNFIKNMISLNNIVTALVNYYKFTGEIEKMTKFSNVEKMIVKDIVSCESIYLI